MKVVKKNIPKAKTAGCLQLCNKQEAVSETAMCEICEIFAHAMCEIFNDCYVTKAALLQMLKKYSIPSTEKYASQYCLYISRINYICNCPVIPARSLIISVRRLCEGTTQGDPTGMATCTVG